MIHSGSETLKAQPSGYQFSIHDNYMICKSNILQSVTHMEEISSPSLEFLVKSQSKSRPIKNNNQKLNISYQVSVTCEDTDYWPRRRSMSWPTKSVSLHDHKCWSLQQTGDYLDKGSLVCPGTKSNFNCTQKGNLSKPYQWMILSDAVKDYKTSYRVNTCVTE